MATKGVLFVVSGPSGVGKGTVKASLYKEFSKCVMESISATTRQPRIHEENGREYYFISRDEFIQRVEQGDFLEHAEFSGNLYGTPMSAVMERLDQGMDVVLEIEVKGALQVMEKMPDCVSVFILPPSFEELEHRLRGRGTEVDSVIRTRLGKAKEEIPMAEKYDYQIVNHTIEQTYQELREIYLKHSRVVHEVYGV